MHSQHPLWETPFPQAALGLCLAPEVFHGKQQQVFEGIEGTIV